MIDSGKFVPEDIFRHLRDGELSIIKQSKSYLKFSNPSNLEKGVLVADISIKIDELSELIGQLRLLSVKSNIKVKRLELLKGDLSLRKEDRIYQLINEDSQFMDLYTLNQNLLILIDYLNDLVWNLRNIIQFYTKTSGAN